LQTLRLPLDLDELASRWSTPADIDQIFHDFRDVAAESQRSHVEVRPMAGRYLDAVYCGDPAAENEATQLDTYFLETEQFRLTVNGEANIVLGRKGSGKTALFLQARDKIRADKNNIVVDLAPEGFQLSRLRSLFSNNFPTVLGRNSLPPFGNISFGWKLPTNFWRKMNDESDTIPEFSNPTSV
jgi:hypothetical protein